MNLMRMTMPPAKNAVSVEFQSQGRRLRSLIGMSGRQASREASGKAFRSRPHVAA